MAESVTRYGIQKLNGENYPVWSYKMELTLIREKLWKVISETKPTTTPGDWDEKDDSARVLIGLTVEDDQLQHIRNAKTAKEAWDSLKGYHQKSTLTNKVHLLKGLCRLVLKEGGNMEDHLHRFSQYVIQLSVLGMDLPDTLVAALLLGSLPDSYDMLVTALESRPEQDFTLQLVKSKLVDEYRKRKGGKELKEDSCGSESAMKAEHQGATRSKATCFFCKKSGHIKAECRKYTQWKNKQQKANKVDICKLAVSSKPIMEKALLGRTTEKPTECWFVDSGATSHMVNSRNFFIDLDSSRKGSVRLADEEKLAEVKGIGRGVLKCVVEDNKVSKMCIADVLYVPSLSSNLLSVKKLSKEGFKVTFENDDCLITKKGELKAIAKLSPELYRIRTAERACAASGAINPGHKADCQHTWHRRFGHRDIDAIKDLARKGLATGIAITDCGIQETCECCAQGKMARTPFPKQAIKKSQAILDLVHTDVCGPLQTVTPNQKRYILTIIDDYSRYCTTFFLRYKSEASTCIKNFVEMTKTQYGVTDRMEVRREAGRKREKRNNVHDSMSVKTGARLPSSHSAEPFLAVLWLLAPS